MNIGKMVDKMTWGSCIPTDSLKSGDNDFSLVHNIRIGAYIDSNKTNLTNFVG